MYLLKVRDHEETNLWMTVYRGNNWFAFRCMYFLVKYIYKLSVASVKAPSVEFVEEFLPEKQ